jgi:hypothetical protein
VEGAAVGEDDQVLLGEVLDDLELLTVDVELLLKSLDDVVGVGVVAVAAKPADRRPADDLVSPSLDGPRRGHSADHQVRAGTRVPRPRVAMVAGSPLATCRYERLSTPAGSAALGGGEESLLLRTTRSLLYHYSNTPRHLEYLLSRFLKN